VQPSTPAVLRVCGECIRRVTVDAADVQLPRRRVFADDQPPILPQLQLQLACGRGGVLSVLVDGG